LLVKDAITLESFFQDGPSPTSFFIYFRPFMKKTDN